MSLRGDDANLGQPIEMGLSATSEADQSLSAWSSNSVILLGRLVRHYPKQAKRLSEEMKRWQAREIFDNDYPNNECSRILSLDKVTEGARIHPGPLLRVLGVLNDHLQGMRPSNDIQYKHGNNLTRC